MAEILTLCNFNTSGSNWLLLMFFSTRFFTCVLASFVLVGQWFSPVVAAPKGKVANVDLTKGGKIPAGASHDWNLGGTGARGWMYSERLTTVKARQIGITKVAKGSPADGVLKPGDVILGVGGKVFSYDSRTEFGKALTWAESEAGKGQLKLTRWREGSTAEVTVNLPVLGTYSATAPYQCEKSRRILAQGCEALAKKMASPNYRGNPITRSLNALGLLSSGDPKYLPLIKKEAQWAAEYKVESFATWWYGYVLMFLSEYVIETGDTSVMPGLKRIAMEAAEGQSNVGSWGHRFAKPNGILMGYGMMNAPGVPLTTALVLAREAGVQDPKVDLAIERSARLLRFYVGKGCVPYGDHAPWMQTHDDNGKNGMAAVLFHLLGDSVAAGYFSSMSVACHGNERDQGHTGNFLNITWAMPGVALLGPNASGAWMEEYGGWYFDLARLHDGTFLHQGPPAAKSDRFNKWDTTGANLLAYAMPLKKLRITGKGKQVVSHLNTAQAKSVVQDGRGWNNLDRNSYYDSLTTEQLLERLGSWSPVVRDRAVMALGRSKAEVQASLVKLLQSKNRYAQYGACRAFKYVKGDHSAALSVLFSLLSSEDLNLRILAAEAMAGIGEKARPAIPAMLKRLANPNTKNDPRRMEQRYLTFALFNKRGGLIGQSLEGVDRALLLDAVRAGLTNEDGRARGSLASIYDKLTLEEIRPFLPAIRDAVAESAPSGIMFASGIRNEGLRLLAKHNVEEGIQVGIDYLTETWPDWGAARRNEQILKHLKSYGVHAKRIVPQLEKIAEEMASGQKARQPDRDKSEIIRKAIKEIQASTHNPKLIRIGS